MSEHTNSRMNCIEIFAVKPRTLLLWRSGILQDKTILSARFYYRPFWIRWLEGRTNIYLGRSYSVGDAQFYSTGAALTFQVNALSISTSNVNNGSWHFLGGEHVHICMESYLFPLIA